MRPTPPRIWPSAEAYFAGCYFDWLYYDYGGLFLLRDYVDEFHGEWQTRMMADDEYAWLYDEW